MTKPHVLVIDDDQFVQNFLSDALEELNYKVTVADNGNDGVVKFKEGEFDYVLLDMQLPDMLGNEVLKKIKKLSPNTIVIMVSGQGSIEIAIESMRLGAYNYLTKPISLKTLKAELDKANENKQRLLEDGSSINMITINGVQADPAFIKF